MNLRFIVTFCSLVLILFCFYSVPGSTQTIRAAHFVLAPSSPEAVAVSFENAIRIVDIVASAGYNTIVVQIANSVEIDSAPALTRRGAWTKEEFRQFVSYAAERDLQVVPEFKFLTHQEKFLQGHYPSLMYNAVTYDPRKQAVYDIVFSILQEFIELIDPPAIHIGHDEVVGWNKEHARKHLAEGERMLPAELFAADVRVIHDFLDGKNVETWMWGDMLLTSDEFPTMLASHLHGGVGNYGKQLRSTLPRDIVICDWHYTDQQLEFPSLTTLQQDGFRVIATTWGKKGTIENFNNYAATNDAYGMMATTWYYLPLGQLDVVERIYATSAKSFNQYTDAE